MSTETKEFARKQVDRWTRDAIIDIIATQMDRANEAKRRIEEEGLVVRDMKGSVIPHPAIKIEIDAGKIIADLIKKHNQEN